MFLPDTVLKYFQLQCNGNPKYYLNLSEVEQVRPFFDGLIPKNILELGCGLGRCSIAFYEAFPSWKKAKFYLLDGNSGSSQICGINYTAENSFYNKLEMTKEFCLYNGMSPNQFHILNAEDEEVFHGCETVVFDVVYSFLAIGFHWLLELYLERLLPHLQKGSILFFGIRPNNTPEFTAFNSYQITNMPKGEFDILDYTSGKDKKPSYLVLLKR